MRTLYPGHQVVVLSLLAQHDATECFTWERLWQYYHGMMLQQRQRSRDQAWQCCCSTAMWHISGMAMYAHITQHSASAQFMCDPACQCCIPWCYGTSHVCTGIYKPPSHSNVAQLMCECRCHCGMVLGYVLHVPITWCYNMIHVNMCGYTRKHGNMT